MGGEPGLHRSWGQVVTGERWEPSDELGFFDIYVVGVEGLTTLSEVLSGA